MIEKSTLDYLISSLLTDFKKRIKKSRFALAAKYLKTACDILYTSGFQTFNKELEACNNLLSQKITYSFKKSILNCKKKILFFDSFGLSHRGLAYIYINGLIKSGFDFAYVTYKENKSNASDLIELVNNSKNGQVFLIRENYSRYYLKKIQKDIGPISDFLFYITPNDCFSFVVSSLFLCKRTLINLTDHAFWLGASSIDYCLEFRSYGYYISMEKRFIPKEKLIILPYYPEMKQYAFEGYPYEKMNKNNTVFSGGSIYKTIDAKLLYYKTITHLLTKHSNLFFWYAGAGDLSNFEELQRRFPNRIFITNERKDLLEIMKHCYLYLSTFPMIGGLMSQYAILGGIPPVSFIQHDISKGILLKEGEEALEFDNFDLYLQELDKLIENKKYYIQVTNSLSTLCIKPKEFEKGLIKFLTCYSNTDFLYNGKKYYLQDNYNIKFPQFSYDSLCHLMAHNLRGTGSIHYIKYQIRGITSKILKK